VFFSLEITGNWPFRRFSSLWYQCVLSHFANKYTCELEAWYQYASGGAIYVLKEVCHWQANSVNSVKLVQYGKNYSSAKSWALFSVLVRAWLHLLSSGWKIQLHFSAFSMVSSQRISLCCHQARNQHEVDGKQSGARWVTYQIDHTCTRWIGKSNSKLIYDVRFTANQFILVSNPLRPTTRDIFLNWALAIIVLIWNPFWRGDRFVSYEYAWPFVKHMYRTYSMLLKSSFCTVYKSSVSTGFAKQIMSILRILCYNGSLVTWTVVSLTIAKFRPLMYFLCLASSCPTPRTCFCHDSVWLLLGACTSLFYNRLHTEGWKPYARIR
jgi:hypothetical protein